MKDCKNCKYGNGTDLSSVYCSHENSWRFDNCNDYGSAFVHKDKYKRKIARLEKKIAQKKSKYDKKRAINELKAVKKQEKQLDKIKKAKLVNTVESMQQQIVDLKNMNLHDKDIVKRLENRIEALTERTKDIDIDKLFDQWEMKKGKGVKKVCGNCKHSEIHTGVGCPYVDDECDYDNSSWELYEPTKKIINKNGIGFPAICRECSSFNNLDIACQKSEDGMHYREHAFLTKKLCSKCNPLKIVDKSCKHFTDGNVKLLNCDMCTHTDKKIMEEPCKHCHNFSKLNAKSKCDQCNFQSMKYTQEPCCNCDVQNSKFKPKEYIKGKLHKCVDCLYVYPIFSDRCKNCKNMNQYVSKPKKGDVCSKCKTVIISDQKSIETGICVYCRERALK